MRPIDSFQIDELDDLKLVERLTGSARKSSPDVSGIRALVLDFDGVMTDNRAIVDQNGREAVLVYRGDGLGISQLVQAGILVYVISTEQNPVVAARCSKLGIPYIQGQADKLAPLQQLARQHGLTSEQLAYVGNDVNDLACMHWVGLPIAVADAIPEVREAAVWVTQAKGGFGAVREIADEFLKHTAQAPVSASRTS